MQHYLLDSNQRLNVSFSKDSVAAYYQCFNQPYRKEVTTINVCVIMVKFDLFKKYANRRMILTKSAINQTQKIEVDIIYVGHLEEIECRQIRNITRYTMALTLTKNDNMS
ncbi:protein vraC [Staphylococcus aureus]|uniref:Protein vraC n=1 Tax=Staphylococcus aureus TaxID=1280 RepID=A0A380DKX5_STAAU|nr:protein vraC [Staphylococcus aureus]